MKIAIIGTTGHVGSLVTAEALDRRHEVTAIVRHPEKLQYDIPFLKKDLFDLTTADLIHFDIVVDAFSAPQGQEELHKTSVEHLIEILRGTDLRLYIVGGAGTLYTDQTKTKKLYQMPGFPKSVYPTSTNMDAGLDALKKTTNLSWTYISPSANFIYSTDKSHGYKVGEEVLLNSESSGESEITMAEYAVAMLDEIETPVHLNKRFTVVSK